MNLITIVQTAGDYAKGQRLRIVPDEQIDRKANEIPTRQAEKLLRTGYAVVGEAAVRTPSETAARQAAGPRRPAPRTKPVERRPAGARRP